MPDPSEFAAIVVGGGPAGWAAACLLAQEGVATAMVAPPARPDVRTVALMQPSIRLLKYVGVWQPDLIATCAPLKHLHIIDDTGNMVSAPALEFSADEINAPEFGWNVPVAQLVPALRTRAKTLGVPVIEEPAASFKNLGDHATLTLESTKVLTAKTIIGADGLNSIIRPDAQISVQAHSFDQSALATSFSHTAPHEFISIEFHKPGGPFTTVPLPGNRSSLVWMGAPQEMERLASLSPEDLAVEIQLASHGRLGRIYDVGPRSLFPMRNQRATVYAANRAYLVGEAAHALPPIGAQGLNMSLRDAGHAADVILAANDPGGDSALKEYDALRRADIDSRLAVVRAVNTSLLADVMPLSILRSAGLSALNLVAPLRNFALKKGMATSEDLPFAMRAAS